MSKTTTKIQKTTKSVKYLRLPMDQKVQSLIAEVQANNPFFDELDAVRYVLGKYIVTNKLQKNRQNLLHWLNENVEKKNLPKMTEEEIFAIAQEI